MQVDHVIRMLVGHDDRIEAIPNRRAEQREQPGNVP